MQFLLLCYIKAVKTFFDLFYSKCTATDTNVPFPLLKHLASLITEAVFVLAKIT